ncbi:MAG: DUF2303 family protein [Methylobacter sp.]
MEQNAVTEIAKLSAAQSANSELRNRGLEAVVIPNDHHLENLEKLSDKPDLFRGQFSTTVLAQFTGYVDQHGSENTGVFLDQDRMTAEAIIDLGDHDTPQWGKHRASVTLRKTPAYAALIRADENRMDQQDFIDWAEDHQDNIAFYYGDSHENSDQGFKATLKTLRKLKTSATATSETEVGNFNANRTAMEAIEVTAGSAQPPAGFLFKAIPHDGFDEVTFDCQLRAITDGKAVQLKYRIVQLAQHQEKIAEQFRDKINAGIHVDEINIFIGNMDYQK